MTPRDLETIIFGCEFEMVFPRGAWTGAKGSYHGARQVEFLPEGWQSKTDSSITCSDGDYFPIEIISPILQGADGLREAMAVADTLTRMGAKVNKSCGFHVHVEWRHRYVTDLRKLAHLTANLEDGLWAATGSYARYRDHGYCYPIKNNAELKRFDRRGLGGCPIARTRYQTLNVTNLLDPYSAKQTVEFRVFAGTTNPVKVAAYIQLCLGLVQKAEHSKVATPWDGKPFSGKNPRMTYGRFTSELNRLFCNIGWGTYTNEIYGILLPETKTPIIKKLRELANKFDDAAGTKFPPPAEVRAVCETPNNQYYINPCESILSHL